MRTKVNRKSEAFKRSSPSLQQRSDEGAFFRQEVFPSQILRITSRAFLVAIRSQDGGAHCEHARRFGARDPHLAECRQRFLVPAQAKTRQAKRCRG